MAFSLAERIMQQPDDERLKDQGRALDSLVRAWETACERERIAAGKPLPGSIRPQAKPRKPRAVGPLVEAVVPV